MADPDGGSRPTGGATVTAGTSALRHLSTLALVVVGVLLATA